MKVVETTLRDCFIIENNIFKDDRGCFFESYNAKVFAQLTGIQSAFVQDNQSHSIYGVLRGLHFQTGEYAQAKLVRVIQGRVLDIAVDLRPNSNTFGKYFSIELSEDNKHQLYIPRGMAHGFVVLSETATFYYKCDNFYQKSSELGILYNDKNLNIDWKLPEEDIILSEKDKNNLTLEQYKNEILHI